MSLTRLSTAYLETIEDFVVLFLYQRWFIYARHWHPLAEHLWNSKPTWGGQKIKWTQAENIKTYINYASTALVQRPYSGASKMKMLHGRGVSHGRHDGTPPALESRTTTGRKIDRPGDSTHDRNLQGITFLRRNNTSSANEKLCVCKRALS